MVKIISIQDDVYEELSKRKKNQSFSQVIRELIKHSNEEKTFDDLEEYFGIVSPETGLKMQNEIENERKRAKPRNIQRL